MSVVISNLTKTYDEKPAIDNLNLTVEDGEFLVLLGPSGCGKTTTMRSIVGLETPDSGSVSVNSSTVFDAESSINVPIHRRRMGMVFQSYAIWPHMTVAQNVEFPLRMLKVGKSKRAINTETALGLVGLGEYANRSATNLSGGQMQRVALARSLVMEPEVLLLDEPLSNLDARLRDKLRFELKEMHQRLGHTSIYVTHDQSEALAMADRIVVMNNGKIEQQGSPTDLYRHPQSSFVARFLGSSNVYTLDQSEKASGLVSTERGLQLVGHDALLEDARYVSIRPEVVRLVGELSSDDQNVFRANVLSSNYLGSHTRVHLELEGSETLYAVFDDVSKPPLAGENVNIHIPVQSVTPLVV